MDSTISNAACHRHAHIQKENFRDLTCSCTVPPPAEGTDGSPTSGTSGGCACSNADVEEQIAHLRAELLHKEQENDRVQLQLAKEKEERERAERQVCCFAARDLQSMSLQ